MDDEPAPIARDRVAFTAGLLVIVIALAPALSWLDQQSTPVFGDEFRLSYGYFIVAGLLGLSLYLYAASVASTSRSERLHSWGDGVYAVAVLSIPAVLFTFLVGALQYAIFPDQAAAESVARIVVLGFLVVILLRIKPLVRALEQIDAARRRARGRAKSGSEMSRALELHRLGFYDMAIVSATNSLISIAEAMMPPQKSRPATVIDTYRWVRDRLAGEIDGLQTMLEEIRKSRNEAAHGRLATTAEESLRIIRNSNLIANSLAPPQVDDNGEI